jgi:hypothetical protein
LRVDLVGGDLEFKLNSPDQISVTSNDLVPEITWTSRDNPNSTVLESGDAIEGDHVIIKADLHSWNVSIVRTAMEFYDFNQTPVEYETEGSNIEVDTYDFGMNVECGMIFTGFSNIGVEVQRELTNLSITNYFAPEIDNITIQETGTEILFISWDIYDRNADDSHLYSILFSRDYGASWQMLAADLNETSFTWDTSPFIWLDDAGLCIRAYDNDETNNTGLTSIYDCWPGLIGQSIIWLEDYGITIIRTTTTIHTSSTTIVNSTSSSNTSMSQSGSMIIFFLWFMLPISISVIVVFFIYILNSNRKRIPLGNLYRNTSNRFFLE